MRSYLYTFLVIVSLAVLRIAGEFTLNGALLPFTSFVDLAVTVYLIKRGFDHIIGEEDN